MGYSSIFKEDREFYISLENDKVLFSEIKFAKGETQKINGRLKPILYKIEGKLLDGIQDQNFFDVSAIQQAYAFYNNAETKEQRLKKLHNMVFSGKELTVEHPFFKEMTFNRCIPVYFDFEIRLDEVIVTLELETPKTITEIEQSKNNEKPELGSTSDLQDATQAKADYESSSQDHKGLIYDMLKKMESIVEKVYQ